MSEKIYGLMVTGKHLVRRPMAYQAIRNFSDQTWPDKHLNVVNTGYRVSPKGNFTHCEIGIPNRILGSLRNAALEYVPNKAVWVQWDDDDYRRNDAIALQYDQLPKTEFACCILQNQIRYDFELNAAWDARSKTGFAGTIMARHTTLIYKPIAIGEDDNYFQRYTLIGEANVWDNPPSLYIRFIHGKNGGTRKHLLGGYKPERNRWDLGGGDAAYLEDVLRRYKRSS